MAECEEQVFTGVTSEHTDAFLAKAAQFGMGGIAGKGTSGEATQMGVTIRWHYDEAARTLAVQCMKAPMLLPCGMINGRIREAVNSVLKSGDKAEQG